MSKLAAALVAACLAATLGSCTTLKNAYSVATGATVSPTAVYVAANSFDALEATATNYLKLPKCGGSATVCRSPTVTAKILPAVRSGRVARNNLETFLAQHPGQLGPSGDYAALTTAISTLQSIYAQYGVH